MKTYIHPLDLRVVDVDVLPTGDGLFRAAAFRGFRELYASEPLSRQKAMCVFRSLCRAAYDCGFWPAPWVVLLYGAVVAHVVAVVVFFFSLSFM